MGEQRRGEDRKGVKEDIEEVFGKKNNHNGKWIMSYRNDETIQK